MTEPLFDSEDVRRLMAALGLMRDSGRYLTPRVTAALEALQRADRGPEVSSDAT